MNSFEDHDLNYFGEGAKFHHVGFAVRSIDAVLENARKTVDPVQKVTVTLFGINGLMVELVEPGDSSSPVSNMLEKGQNIYHMCMSVPDIENSIRTARQLGFHCIAQPVPAAAFEDRKIAWLFSPVYGLIELLELESAGS